MLLYDLPLTKSGLSIKCLGGLFTRTKTHQQSLESKQQQWFPKTYHEVIVAKTTSFELYKYKRSQKAEKIDLGFVAAVDVYGEICSIEVCTIKILQSKEYVDIVIVTLNTGQVAVYHYARDQKKFVCSFKDIVFKSKIANLQNPRQVGNYITCSQQNHFLITSVRCHKKLYSIQATQYEQKLRLNVKAQDLKSKQNMICWNVIWLPSMANQSQYLGKYVAIQKSMASLERQQSFQEGMIDEKDETVQNVESPRLLKYYYVDRFHKLNERQETKAGFRILKSTAHMLIPISSSSFFILYENSIYLRQLNSQSSKQQIIDCQFPLREALVDKNIKSMFSCYSRQSFEDRKYVIYLVNEFGDLFKLEYSTLSGLISHFSIKYVNSIKTVHSLVYVGEIQSSLIKLGQYEPFKVKHESASLVLFGLERFAVSLYFIHPPKQQESKPKEIRVQIRAGKPKSNKSYPWYSEKQSFKPISQRSKDLQISDEIQHMGVVMDARVASLRSSQRQEGKQQNFQIFALTNSGNLRHQQHIDQTIDNIEIHKSHLKIIKKGLKIKEVNSLDSSKMHQIYCFKKSEKEPHHKIAIMCGNNKTISYTINNDTFVGYKELNFEESIISIYIGKLQDQSYIQVSSSKIRHLRNQKNGPREITIKNKVVHAVSLGRHIFVALFGGQVFYFELDKDKNQIEHRKQFYVSDEIVSLELTPLEMVRLETGNQKKCSRFLLIGTKSFQIYIYKMNHKNEKQISFEHLYSQNIKSPIQSITAILCSPEELNFNAEKEYAVFLGMENGSMIKMEFDHSMKKVSHKVSQIGTKPVKIKKCSIGSKRQDSLLITSDRCYVYYVYNGKYKMHVLGNLSIDIATEMKMSQNPNTLLTFSQKTTGNKDCLRILSIESLGLDFHEQKVDLFFSGKKLIVFDNNVGLIQADPSYTKVQKTQQENDIDVEKNIIEIQNLEKTWKSQFTIYKIKDNTTRRIAAIYFDQTKEICLCAAYNSIKTGPNIGNFLIFGCAEGINYYPKFQAKQQSIKIYSWIVERRNNQKQIQYKTQFLYSLNIDAIPLVIEPFFKDEKFLIGIGKSMRLYEIGKKKLLLKAEVRNLSSAINQIRTIGKKIYVTFISDSFHLFKYIPEEKTFYDIAEDQLPKFITAMNILDSETVCAGDKFGNIFVGRLTQNAKTQFENATGASKMLQSGHLCKFNILANLNVGQIVTSINKASLYSSKVEVILYSTIMGQLRVLYPLTEYEEVKVLPLLEQKLKSKLKIQSIEGNNWGSSKNVVMGEIVEKFLSLTEQQQKDLLKETQIIDQNYADYVKDMIEGIRTKII